MLEFAAQHPNMTLGEILQKRVAVGTAVNLFVPQKNLLPLRTSG